MRRLVLLLIDDDPVMHEVVAKGLRRTAEGPLEIVHAYSPGEALRTLGRLPTGTLVVLSDYEMEADTNGVGLLRSIAKERPEAVKFLYSGHPRSQLEREADSEIVDGIFEKPLAFQEFSREMWQAARGLTPS